MVYLLLAFASIYCLLWIVGLALTMRSSERNLAVPALGVLGFMGLTGFAGMTATEALDNPHKLVAEKYTQLEVGMNPDQVKALFGDPAPIEQKYELTTYHIGMPKGLNRSLSKEKRHVERVEASMKVKISGEPSKANLGRRGEGLGAPANRERSGLMGLSLKLVENENETIITEGEHWNYEDDDTPEIVAKKIGEAIDATESWTAVGSTDEEPNMITIEPALEANFGTACNEGNCTVQVVAASEPEPVAEGEEEPALDVTTAVIIRSKTDGKAQDFRGGASEAYVWIWDEKGVVLDTDFSNADRIVVVGFDDHKVVSFIQAGLGVEAPPAKKAAADGGAG
ncbi:MAG: hypothetical protein CL927_17145 [Deltaproteobacteria bacterium]|nr:hypothetical protein [Deltaproteobacteria bacterium]HCH61234.1 hypothetical protein [Deltaproteobacteria bacterium]